MMIPPRAKDRRSGFVVNEVNDTREFGTRICDLRVPKGMDGFREGEANAILIAAAPELLDALRLCITDDAAHCLQHQETPGAMARRLRAINELARAAIAKATAASK
jgi:hypothetical protein